MYPWPILPSLSSDPSGQTMSVSSISLFYYMAVLCIALVLGHWFLRLVDKIFASQIATSSPPKDEALDAFIGRALPPKPVIRVAYLNQPLSGASSSIGPLVAKHQAAGLKFTLINCVEAFSAPIGPGLALMGTALRDRIAGFDVIVVDNLEHRLEDLEVTIEKLLLLEAVSADPEVSVVVLTCHDPVIHLMAQRSETRDPARQQILQDMIGRWTRVLAPYRWARSPSPSRLAWRSNHAFRLALEKENDMRTAQPSLAGWWRNSFLFLPRLYEFFGDTPPLTSTYSHAHNAHIQD